MATPVQATAATAGAGGLALAGAYGITSLTKEDNPEEEAVDLSKEQLELLNEPHTTTTFELKAPTTELDQPYQAKILQVTKKENLNQIVKGTVETNKEWWDWAFKQKYSNPQETQKDSIFKNITSGFDASTSNQKALNQACELAYKTDKTKFDEENNYLVSNIGAFCTKGPRKLDLSEPRVTVITTVDSSSGYENKLAGTGNNKTVLAKVKEEASEQTNFNKFWWKWVHKNRFPKATTDLSDPFKKVTGGYSDSEVSASDNDETSLNQACNEVYKKDKAGVTSTNANVLRDAKLFCTVNGNNNLQAPAA